MNPEKLLTTFEIAQYCGVSYQTIRKWVEKEGMPHYRGVSRLRFLISEVNYWMKERSKRPYTITSEEWTADFVMDEDVEK